MVFRIILQNVIFVKVQIRDFPDNKSMDCNKTEMADVRLFDCCNLLRFMMNLILSHGLAIIFHFKDIIPIGKFQSCIKSAVSAMNGVVIIITANVSHVFEFLVAYL